MSCWANKFEEMFISLNSQQRSVTEVVIIVMIYMLRPLHDLSQKLFQANPSKLKIDVRDFQLNVTQHRL